MTLRWDQRSRVSQYVGYWLNPASQGVPVEYLIIAGGGSGGSRVGGGGGAGGYRSSVQGENSGAGSTAEAKIILTTGSYTVTVGAGGAAVTQSGATGVAGNAGSTSSIGSITSTGGGGGGAYSGYAATTGGSGGGAGGYNSGATANGAAGTSGQGSAGGNGVSGAPGLLLKGNATALVVRAFAATANVITIHGFVNQITA